MGGFSIQNFFPRQFVPAEIHAAQVHELREELREARLEAARERDEHRRFQLEVYDKILELRKEGYTLPGATPDTPAAPVEVGPKLGPKTQAAIEAFADGNPALKSHLQRQCLLLVSTEDVDDAELAKKVRKGERR